MWVSTSLGLPNREQSKIQSTITIIIATIIRIILHSSKTLSYNGLHGYVNIAKIIKFYPKVLSSDYLLITNQ